jgi:hypothetical protein
MHLCESLSKESETKQEDTRPMDLVISMSTVNIPEF